MDHRKEILEQALSLPPEDRAYIAIALEDSLTAAVAGGEFLAELQRRSAAYRAGVTTARPAAQVLAELKRRQAGEARV